MPYLYFGRDPYFGHFYFSRSNLYKIHVYYYCSIVFKVNLMLCKIVKMAD